MTPSRKPAPPADPETQLASFIAKFDDGNQKLIRACRKAMRKRLPTANELVYDNYNFFVIGYSPNERPSDSLFSIAAQAKGASLCFLYGATLADPDALLQGSGSQTRFVRLDSAASLNEPAIEALITAAIAQSKVPLPASGKGKLIIRSVAEKQRPRK